MSTDSDLAPGTVFGKDFRIVKALRAGGMGAVYVVDQLSTGKQRALKVMAPELAVDPAIRERFVLEARAASRIESDHVVEIVTAGVDEVTGAPYLVMELLKGQELADALAERGPLPLGDVAEVLAQIGHALEQAHAQGIVHRDLKPENIFLCVSKRRDVAFTAKILDFGIAKLVEDSRQKTGTQPLGTPLFMSPEQTDRKGRICPATDVWALGLIAFRLLTGFDFWREADGSLPQLLREIVVDEIPYASVRARELGVADGVLPPGFDAWFAKCVNRDIDARFPEAGSCVRAFAELVPKGASRGMLAVNVTAPALSVVSGTSGSVQLRPSGASVSDDANARTAAAVLATSALMSSTTGSASVASQTMGAPQKGGSRIWLVAVPAVLAGGAAAFFLLRGEGGDAGNAVPPSTGSAALMASAAVTSSASPAAAAPGTCPEGMVLIEGGKMVMGAKDASEDALITHKVTVSSFCLDRTEVTVKAYQACVDEGECEKSPGRVNYEGMTPESAARFNPLCNAGKAGREEHPINCVDWKMASAYCAWRKARLPTEAEWEYAARGSSQRTYPWGDDEPGPTKLNACGAECVAWGKQNHEDMKPMYDAEDGFPATAPVGSFPEGKSSAGVLDLAGNVWEWTADWYAPYTPDDAVDPKGPEQGEKRVVRGGAFNGWMADWAKPAWRWKSKPETYNHAIGFRCAASVTR